MTPKQIIAEIMDRIVDRPGHNMLAHEITKKLAAAGYVIVPAEPTRAMLDVAMAVVSRNEADQVYCAMINAAPK